VSRRLGFVDHNVQVQLFSGSDDWHGAQDVTEPQQLPQARGKTLHGAI
jgi:hypothetical protein